MSSKFRRMTLHSILERNDADTIPVRWVEALVKCAKSPIWSSGQRQLILKYARCLTSMGGEVDSIYPHHPKFSGSLHDCILYYIGFWSGRLRELIKRWTSVGEYSPRAWGILRGPIEKLENADSFPLIQTTREGNQYVLHL